MVNISKKSNLFESHGIILMCTLNDPKRRNLEYKLKEDTKCPNLCKEHKLEMIIIRSLCANETVKSTHEGRHNPEILTL